MSNESLPGEYAGLIVETTIRQDGLPGIVLEKETKRKGIGEGKAPAFWKYTGGKRQVVDEDILATAVREGRSETNLDIKREDLVLIYSEPRVNPNTGAHYTYFLFFTYVADTSRLWPEEEKGKIAAVFSQSEFVDMLAEGRFLPSQVEVLMREDVREKLAEVSKMRWL